MANFSFNLIDELWIPCVDLKGNYHLFGICDLLMQAHELRSIQHQNPLTEAALLRLLLAVIHRAVDGPRNSREWKELYQAGKFDCRIPEYLKKCYPYFDLFSSEAPFYQTPGLLIVDESGNSVPQSISSIMLGVASGNNKTLFDHTTDDLPVMVSPAEAAHILITAQMFSLGGLNKKTTNLFNYQFRFESSEMVNSIFILLVGRSLFETLMLNLLIYNDNEPIPNSLEDCPVWERKDRGQAITNKEKPITPKGYLDYLTCKSRHILLMPQKDANNVYVEHIHIAQGERFSGIVNPGCMSKKSKKGNWYHPQLDVDRLVWRDSVALFSFDVNVDERPKAFRQVQSMRDYVDLPARYICTAFALANDRANPLAWCREKLNIPISLLSDRNVVAYLEKGMLLSEQTFGVIEEAVRIFMREYLPEKSKSRDVNEKAKGTGVIRMYWDRMEGHFHQFLLDMDDPQNAIEKWEKAVKQTAHESLDLCVKGRYRDSARSYRAWSAASDYLNMRFATLYK
jgi:CRISPR system Cascade subunit CasA